MRYIMKSAAVAVALCSVLAAQGCGAPQVDGAARTGLAALRVAPLDKTGSDGSIASLEAPASAVPTVAPTATVYRVVRGRGSKSRARAIAMSLGVAGTESTAGTRVRRVGRGASFELDTDTGSFDYTTAALEQQSQPLEHVLSDEEYRARAEEFLAQHGLMERTARFKDVNRDNVVAVYDGTAWTEHPYMIEVRFNHEPLDGVPFDQGVGPRIVVQFGEEGRILGATSVWREVEPFARYPIETPQQAVAQVESGDAQVFDAARDSRGVATTMSLSYISDPAGYAQEYVIPHYVIRGRVSGRDNRFTAITRAVDRSMLIVDPAIATAGAAWPATGRRTK